MGSVYRAGVPDILVCWKGRFYGLELKTPKGRPTVLQLHEISSIHQAGGEAKIIRSLKEAKELLGVE